MPSSTSHLAKSGWSDGPCPQMPMYLFKRKQVEIARCSITFTAALRSSNVLAIGPPLSRSTPKVSWVMSFEPMEKPSKYSRNCSASSALLGTSHIIIKRKPFLPRSKPFSLSTSNTALASASVRTKGIITSTLVSPITSRTYFTARHSSAKQGLKSSDT